MGARSTAQSASCAQPGNLTVKQGGAAHTHTRTTTRAHTQTKKCLFAVVVAIYDGASYYHRGWALGKNELRLSAHLRCQAPKKFIVPKKSPCVYPKNRINAHHFRSNLHFARKKTKCLNETELLVIERVRGAAEVKYKKSKSAKSFQCQHKLQRVKQSLVHVYSSSSEFILYIYLKHLII